MAYKTIHQPTEKSIVQFCCKFATQSRRSFYNFSCNARSLPLCKFVTQLLPRFEGSKSMARKKNAKKPAAQKRVAKLDKSFTCPFCHHRESVECTIDKKLKIGKASCYVCSESYCVKINFLTEAIDM
uniref:Transcription elongation factor 1 homolog n=1 Tax=Kalanchoe fedtschenkoi TaxID=63787 RepID=A0A7N0VN05_KALFE